MLKGCYRTVVSEALRSFTGVSTHIQGGLCGLYHPAASCFSYLLPPSGVFLRFGICFLPLARCLFATLPRYLSCAAFSVKTQSTTPVNNYVEKLSFYVGVM
jgi:hypothetical protein